MRKLVLATAIGAVMLSGSALAAKPTSISYSSKGTTTEGIEFANYTVKCSNGKRQPLTAWNKRKKWCVGQESQELCHKKQMKAAKAACKLN